MEFTESGETVVIKTEGICEVSFEAPFLIDYTSEEDKPVIEISVNEEPVEHEEEWTIAPQVEIKSTKFTALLTQPVNKKVERVCVHLTHKDHKHDHFVVVRSGNGLTTIQRSECMCL